MKRLLVLFPLCIVLNSLPSLGQIHVGPALGSQLSWVSFNDEADKDAYSVKPVVGINAGVCVSFVVRKRFFLHTSILYSTKGKKLVGEEDRLLKYDARYRYIDVPILYAVDFQGRTGSGKSFKYYIGVGPNISYWLSGKGELFNTDFSELGEEGARPYKVAFGKDDQAINENQMGVPDPNRLQLGLNIGAGLVLEPSYRQKVILQVRYEFGHSFFSRTSNGEFRDTYFQDPLQSRNQGVRVSVAYLIDLKLEDRKRGKSTQKNR